MKDEFEDDCALRSRGSGDGEGEGAFGGFGCDLTYYI